MEDDDPSQASLVPSAWLTPFSPLPAVAPSGSRVLHWQRLWGCGHKRGVFCSLMIYWSDSHTSPPQVLPQGWGLGWSVEGA